MNINITIGQYYPTESKIHDLDPRTKLLATILFIVGLFLVKSFWAYLFAAMGLAVVIYMTNVPPKYMFRGLRGIIFIIMFTVIINIFFTSGETVLLTIWKLKITKEGIYMGIKMGVRLIMLVVGSSILTLTTSPLELTDGIEIGLSPLKKIGFPAHEVAMIMTIALRFIPTLAEEVDRIMKAQMARGADFDTGNIIDKAKSLIPLLVPLFISAFQRADDLALAMEARCYRGDVNRTRMKTMKFTRDDYKFFTGLGLFLIGLFVINRYI